ncbi:protein IRON-RELATED TRANSCRIPTION FACTOR 3-like [Phragmites australis]|uniref:protein IRON-RELATED TRANSCRIPTION FACTOR 3-like n=1 Tax=Phragmites australis TaxID=29695 RepID=UPI002D77456F|nr:protein IRON-RELATED TRANSCRIPTION FACTOR 3-like [Phragmites australis]
MVPSDRGSVATAVSTPAADKLLHGPVSGKKIQKKAPRKVHKAEREKLKRDQLNDLFVELGDILDENRQNNGKACILADTTRILRDLLSQVESLRKENGTLQNESHYVTMERDELRDETTVLGKEILELQNELRMRLSTNPGWGHGTAESDSVSAVFPSQQPVQPPSIASTIIPLQQPLAPPTVIELSYAAPPRELKLFPKTGYEPSKDQEAPNHVARPQARYPTQASSWPVSLFSGLPRMEDEQCSSGTIGTSMEASTGRD